jgi:hypothetical protein
MQHLPVRAKINDTAAVPLRRTIPTELQEIIRL